LGGGSITTGYNFGVKGFTASTAYDAAGVKGVGGFGDPLGDNSDCGPCQSAGVRGMNGDSTSFSFGVLGISQAKGVGGIVLDDSNVWQTYGVLGYRSAGLSAAASRRIASSSRVYWTHSFLGPPPRRR
jgi:hypothetical protein